MAKKQLFAAVKAYYESQGWRFEVKEDRDRIEMLITLRDFNACRVITRVYDKRFSTYCIFPVRVPEAARSRAGEYLHRANYGLNIGNFEFDYNDGEVRYKANIQCGEAIPAMDIIERLVDVGMDMVIRYGDGLMKVIYGKADPKKTIREIEEHTEENLPPDLEALLREHHSGDEDSAGEALRRLESIQREMEAQDGEDGEDGGDEPVRPEAQEDEAQDEELPPALKALLREHRGDGDPTGEARRWFESILHEMEEQGGEDEEDDEYDDGGMTHPEMLPGEGGSCEEEAAGEAGEEEDEGVEHGVEYYAQKLDEAIRRMDEAKATGEEGAKRAAAHSVDYFAQKLEEAARRRDAETTGSGGDEGEETPYSAEYFDRRMEEERHRFEAEGPGKGADEAEFPEEAFGQDEAE